MYGAVYGDACRNELEVKEMRFRINYRKKLLEKNPSLTRETVLHLLDTEPDAHVPFKERIEIFDSRIPLMHEESIISDDTHMTYATAKAVLYGLDYEKTYREVAKKELAKGLDKFGRNPFGKRFSEWANGLVKGDSYGNGCAMRISPIILTSTSLESCLNEVEKSVISSHNHPDSIFYSKALAEAMYHLKCGLSKEEVKRIIELKYFSLDYDLIDLQRNNTFSSSARITVPHALFCFLESNNFEDAIRISLSIGGDTDTVAAMSGALAEFHYGMPEDFIEQTKKIIPQEYIEVFDELYRKDLEQKWKKSRKLLKN